MSALRQAGVTVVLTTLLFGGKLVAAVLSDSIGVVSTAIDSGLDLIISLTVLVGIRTAQRPPDPDHPYGHGKFENVAGLSEAGLLAATGVIVGFLAIERILDPPEINVGPVVIGVLVVSMLVAAERAWSLSRAAQDHRSPALQVDTWHYLSDLITTGVVLIGLYAAQRIDPRADGVAALIVGVFIVAGSVYVGYQAVGGLVDRVEPRLVLRVERAIQSVDDVEGTPQVRMRGAGPDLFVDATVEVPRSMGIERAHEVMDEVEQAVRDELGEADVTVHAEPVQASESIVTTLEVLASRDPAVLGIHEIFVDELDDGLVIDCHVEVDEALTLHEAHTIAQRFEAQVKRTVPGVVGMRTHIEPMPTAPRVGQDVTATFDELVERIEASIQPPFDSLGGISVKRVAGRLEVVVSVTMEGSMPLERAHEASERFEHRLMGKLPEVDRIVVHVEPAP